MYTLVEVQMRSWGFYENGGNQDVAQRGYDRR